MAASNRAAPPIRLLLLALGLSPAAGAQTSGMTHRAVSAFDEIFPRGSPTRSLVALIDQAVALHNASATERATRFRILELGAGEGRVVLELKARYPYAEVIGVNKFHWGRLKTVGGAQNSNSPGVLFAAARSFNISGVDKANLPTILDHDIRKPLPLADLSAHVVLSQHTLNHLVDGYKLDVIREVKRVLAPGGLAVVRWTGYKLGHPFLAAPEFQKLAQSSGVLPGSAPTAGLYRCCVDPNNKALGRSSHAFEIVLLLTKPSPSSGRGLSSVVEHIMRVVTSTTAPISLEQLDAEEQRLPMGKPRGQPMVARWVLQVVPE